MATKITTLYDQVLVRLAAIFPNKTRIPNPYSVESNIFNLLRDGWGLRVDDMSDFLNEYNNITNEQTLTVILSKEVVKTDAVGTSYDAPAKALLEDVVTLKKEMLGFDQLLIPDSVTLISAGAVSGIEEILGNKTNFIKIEASFVFRLIEAL